MRLTLKSARPFSSRRERVSSIPDSPGIITSTIARSNSNPVIFPRASAASADNSYAKSIFAQIARQQISDASVIINNQKVDCVIAWSLNLLYHCFRFRAFYGFCTSFSIILYPSSSIIAEKKLDNCFASLMSEFSIAFAMR